MAMVYTNTNIAGCNIGVGLLWVKNMVMACFSTETEQKYKGFGQEIVLKGSLKFTTKMEIIMKEICTCHKKWAKGSTNGKTKAEMVMVRSNTKVNSKKIILMVSQ